MNIQKLTTVKTILIALVLSINANQLFAQTTNGIFFQAVARDNFSNPAKDRKIYVQSSIIQTTTTGTKVLTEEHQTNTDITGVFSISLGNGVRVGGTASGLATIDWSKGPFYLNLKVAITPIGGNSNWDYTKEWVDMGTTSFGAVPFALYSASSAKVDDKLNVTDTTKMLAVYAKAMSVQNLTTAVASKLTAADTLTMLKPYAKAAYTIDSTFFKTQLATKLSISDSTKYVTPTQLASYNFPSSGTNTTTTSVTIDTTSLSNRINSKASATDLINLTTTVTSNTASITANAASVNLKAPIASPSFTGTLAIGTTNPSAAAALDITSTSQGLLLPRLTYAQKMSINSPLAGLVLWCSDCGNNGEMEVYNGTLFVNIIGGSAALALPAISSTTGAYSITTSSAVSGGIISSDGGATITTRGIVWGTSTGPTIALATKTNEGTGVGTYTSTITGLSSGVTYFVRAYATNSIGTRYGSEITFNSAKALASLGTTTAAAPTGATTALSGGSIGYNGGATVTASGLVWSTTSNPTIDLATKTTDGATTGTFTSSITGLTSGVTYYIRSYATNSVGTNYGTEITFIAGLRVPTVESTLAASSIGQTIAVSGGNITSNGGSPVTVSGLVWSTTTNPTIDLTTKTTDGTTSGTFTSSITGLTLGTTYYARAYATNIVGTSYGPNITFTPGGNSYSFVLTLNNGIYTYSTYKFDGNAWTYIAAAPVTNQTGYYVGQINNINYSFIYNGSGYSTYSLSGSTWSQVSTSGTAPTNGLYGGNYLGNFNNKLYHYAYNGTSYNTYSFDGTSWQTVSTSGTGPSGGLYGGYLGVFNNKSYFAAYNGMAYSLYSFDGSTWTTISSLGSNGYNFIGQIGNTSYLGYYNGSSYVYSKFDGTSFASWSPSGLPLNTNPYNFNFMGVINNKLYTAINTSGTPIMYSFDGTSFTNLSSITNPGNYYGGWNCYMCNSFFIGGNLK